MSVLSHSRAAEALAVCATRPLTSTLAAIQIGDNRFEYPSPRAVMYGVEDDVALRSVTWAGANIIPVATTPDQRPAIAERIVARGQAASSVLGDADEVLSLWDSLRTSWNRPREIRGNQPLLVMDNESAVAPDPLVRRGAVGEAPIVQPASVAMFIEEVGYDPTRYGGGYARRVAQLLGQGRTWIRTEPHPVTGEERVVFKADVGALALGVAQIQGVWVAPDRRGQGLGVSGMAAVVRDVLRDLAPTVSLYVNDYNTAGLATYRRLGMRQEATYATVVL
ncbi:MAG: GNAT family N-acetyltransferase [Actinomycetaceae bacterium]